MLSEKLTQLLDEIAVECKDVQDQGHASEGGGSPVDQFFHVWQDIEESYDARDDETLKWEWFFELQKLAHALCQEYAASLASLKRMEESRVVVLRKTMSLHDECEEMTNARIALEHRAEQIQSKLEHFHRVKTIANTLDQGFGVAFDSALDELDESMAFLEDHKDYLQAEAYLRYFGVLRDKICTGIRTTVHKSLERSQQQVLEEIWRASQDPNAQMETSVFHAKFRQSAAKIKGLTQLLCSRMYAASSYMTTLEALESFYERVRTNVLSGVLQSHMNSLAADPDLAATTRTAASYTVSLCQTEKLLFEDHFGVQRAANGEALKNLLEFVANTFANAFRPKVLACDQVDDLREVADCLQIDVLMAQRDAKSSQALLPSVMTIVYRLHKDVLERLIFRIHIFLRDDIRGFPIDPTHESLNYPDLLWNEEEFESRGYRIGWFPTLDRTLVALSKIYRILEIHTFQGLAQEAVETCLHTLRAAADVIKQKESVLDSGLFMIKHLLILREQAAAFECDLVSREKFFDFSGVYSGFTKMLQTENTLFGYSSRLVEILTPKIHETSYDTRRDIEFELKQACEVLIRETVQAIARPLILFNAYLEDYKKNPKGELKSQPFMHPTKLQEVVERVQQNMIHIVPLTVAKLCVYLSPHKECNAKDKMTVTILFKPIQVSIVESWAQLGQIFEEAQIQIDYKSKEKVEMEMAKLVSDQQAASWEHHVHLVQANKAPSRSTERISELQPSHGSRGTSPTQAVSQPFLSGRGSPEGTPASSERMTHGGASSSSAIAPPQGSAPQVREGPHQTAVLSGASVSRSPIVPLVDERPLQAALSSDGAPPGHAGEPEGGERPPQAALSSNGAPPRPAGEPEGGERSALGASVRGSFPIPMPVASSTGLPPSMPTTPSGGLPAVASGALPSSGPLPSPSALPSPSVDPIRDDVQR